MKKSLLMLMAVGLVAVSCKKNTEPAIVNDDEITIGTAGVEVVKGTIDAAATQFENNDIIGVYSVAHVPSGSTAIDLTTAYQANSQYKFNISNTVWSPVDPAQMLKWQFQVDGSTPNKVNLIGYYPYAATPTVDADNKSVTFDIPVDQTTNAQVKSADLMWARSTGKTGAGVYEQLKSKWSLLEGVGIYKKNDLGKKIDLKFYHMLSSIKFKVAFKHGADVAATKEVYSDIKIKKIEVLGPDVTVSGKLDMDKGIFTATANVAPAMGNIAFIPAAADQPPFATILAHDATIKPTDYVSVCDVVVSPTAAFNGDKNLIKFTVLYKYDKDGTAAGDDSKLEKYEKEYIYPLGSAGTIAKFEVAKQLQANVLMKLSSDEIRISTSIVPWDTATSTDIEAK